MLTTKRMALTTALFISASAFALGPAAAAGAMDSNSNMGTGKVQTETQATGNAGANASVSTTNANAMNSGEASDARETVNNAAQVVKQMQQDPNLTKALKQAKGIFIVPSYGKGAFLVGGAGGEGVLVTNNNGKWSNPVFYNIGAISVGAEAGASGGSIAMLLMTNDAVQSFQQQNNFSLNANADLSVIDWSANAQGNWGKGDVIMWSDTEGLFAGVGLSASDIVYDGEATQAFYGQQTTPQKVLNSAANKNAATLTNAFPG